MMSSGVKRELRYMILPWLLYNFLFVLLMLVFGGWLVYTYYSLVRHHRLCNRATMSTYRG